LSCYKTYIKGRVSAVRLAVAIPSGAYHREVENVRSAKVVKTAPIATTKKEKKGVRTGMNG